MGIRAKDFVIPLYAAIIVVVFSSQAPGLAPGNSNALPESFSHYLDSLKNADNLEEWLISINEYIGEDPPTRIALYNHARSKAWRKCRTSDECIAWFDLLANQGNDELIRGNILGSIDAYENAYLFSSQNNIPSSEVQSYVLRPLGNNYTRLGDLERAQFIHAKSLAMATRDSDSMFAAAAYCNLATTARTRGNLDSAQLLTEKGLALVIPGSSLHGLLLSTSADILYRLKLLRQAEAAIREAVIILRSKLSSEDGDASYWLLSAYQVYGNILREKGEMVSSLKNYEKGIQLIDTKFQGQRKREKAKLLVSMGEVMMAMRETTKALDKFNKALAVMIPGFSALIEDDLPQANKLYAENTIIDAVRGKAECLVLMGNKARALDCYMLLFPAARKLRLEFFSSDSKRLHQAEGRSWASRAMDIAHELWREQGDNSFAEKMLLIAEMSKAQLLLDEIMSNMHHNRLRGADTLLERELRLLQAVALYERESALSNESKDVSPVFRELQYDLSLIKRKIREKYPMAGSYDNDKTLTTAKELLKNIPKKAFMVEFFSGVGTLYVITADRDGIHKVKKLENREGKLVADFISKWFQAGPKEMMNAPGQYYGDAYKLYQLLLEGNLRGNEKGLLIIPDGVLGYLPFDALVTAPVYHENISEWPFLAREKNIFFSYSLQTLGQIGKTEAKKDQFTGFFISFDSSLGESLPAVRSEYNSLRQLVRGDFFTENEASLEAFRQQLPRVNLLHISTHSFLHGTERIPALELADSKFFLFELNGHAFHPQLVVLSACRTGHGMLAEGEGIISLARGFTSTGAEGIVAGMWNMNDEATANMIKDFYIELAKGETPSSALHEVKIKWLNKNHDAYMDLPYYWAGMVYFGNDKPVDIKTRNTSRVAWMAAIFVLFLGSALLYSRKRKKRTIRQADYEREVPQHNL